MTNVETSPCIVKDTICNGDEQPEIEKCQGRIKNNLSNYNNILTCSSQLVHRFNILKNPLNSINLRNPYYQQVRLGKVSQMNHSNGIHNDESLDYESLSAQRKGSLNNVNDGDQNLNKCDINYKTWPERCDKTKEPYCEVKSQIDSVNVHVNNGFNLGNNNCKEPNGDGTHNNSVRGCLDMSKNDGCAQGTMRLNQALDNISLAYNPITKQLHFITPKNPDRNKNSPQTNQSDSESKKGSFSDEGNYSLSTCDKSDSISYESPRSTLIRSGHQRGADGGSFSSTVSSLSEGSLSGICIGKDDVKDDTVCNTKESQEIFAKSDEVKVKKKGLSGFFSRSVFPWRSTTPSSNRSECKVSPPSETVTQPPSSWKLFAGKGYTPAGNGTTEVPHPADTPASSGASTPLHQHRRQGSNASAGEVKQFEDLVASSIALIQHNRPSNLPAKDTAEEYRHRLEYQRMVEAARRREVREARDRRRQLAKQVRHEDDLSAALREWNLNILPAWETTKLTRKTRDLWWCGLPPAVRGKVWQLAIPNNLSITPQLYHICVERAKQKLLEVKVRKNGFKKYNARSKNVNGVIHNNHEHVKHSSEADIEASNQNTTPMIVDNDIDMTNGLSYTSNESLNYLNQDEITSRLTDRSMVRNYSEQNLKNHYMDVDSLRQSSQSNPDLCEFSNERSMELIQLDIARTFPNLCIFQPGGPYFDVLHELLAAYVCYRPDVGYVQGMSFLAAILILNMDAPEAFICFTNILNGPVLRAAFTLDGAKMQILWNVYSNLMEANLPIVHKHFEESGLGPELYLLEWLYSVFAKSMPLDVACRVWDVFLRDGDEFLFKTALGVLHLYQEELVKMDFITASQFLTKLPEDLSSDALFKSINTINMMVDRLSFQQLVDKHKENTTPDEDMPNRTS